LKYSSFFRTNISKDDEKCIFFANEIVVNVVLTLNKLSRENRSFYKFFFALIVQDMTDDFLFKESKIIKMRD